MCRATIAAILLLAVPASALGQPEPPPTLTVVETSGDTVWTWLGPWSPCIDHDGGWAAYLVQVSPCPLASITPCDTTAGLLTFMSCDPEYVGFSCHQDYAIAYIWYWFTIGGGQTPLGPITTYTFVPSVDGCEKDGVPIGACCAIGVENGCSLSTAKACSHMLPVGGIYVGDYTVCQPTPPCIVPAKPHSWGHLKTLYR